MLFSGMTFLYYFLPAVLIAYFLVPKGGRNAVLLIASLVFYAWGEPKYTPVLISSALINWLAGMVIERIKEKKRAKAVLACAVAIDIGMLVFFKYTDFFIKNINSLADADLSLLSLALPLGISFYTFQSMSYVIDVYRGDVKAAKSFFSFATYLMMFPQLVAGPIVRYKTVADELKSRSLNIKSFSEGVVRFCVGLAKKVLIANVLGELVSALKLTVGGTVVSQWAVAIAYALQIYYDFSGYSDMAIGLGRMLGFRFPENFDHPYMSKSVSEFWRRWHITLGGWFRDYLYIPLGGNRVKTPRWMLNVLVVWALTGFWHGAEWSFIIWGAYFGVLLLGERLLWGKLIKRSRVAGHVTTLLLVLISFVIFGSQSLSEAGRQLMGMLGSGMSFSSPESLYYIGSYAIVLVIAVLGATPLPAMIGKWIRSAKAGAVAVPLWCAALLVLSTAFLIEGSFNPFLYFRF